jgi:hypothetical protein
VRGAARPLAGATALGGILCLLAVAVLWHDDHARHRAAVATPSTTWAEQGRRVRTSWWRLAASPAPQARSVAPRGAERSAPSIKTALEAMQLANVHVTVVRGWLLEASGVSDSPDYLRLLTFVRNAVQRGVMLLAHVTDRAGHPLVEAGGASGRLLAWVSPALLSDRKSD